jgi:hypothetical protein
VTLLFGADQPQIIPIKHGLRRALLLTAAAM